MRDSRSRHACPPNRTLASMMKRAIPEFARSPDGVGSARGRLRDPRNGPMTARQRPRYEPSLPAQQSWIRRQARRVLSSRARSVMDSQDLAQEAQHAALRDAGGCEFRSEGSFRAWMRVVLRNLAAKAMRRPLPVLSRGKGWSRIPGVGSTPSAGLRREDARGRWRRLSASLSKRDRKVVTLRLVEGLPFKAVGDRLGMDEGHARVTFNRCVKRLRESARDDVDD